MLKTAHVFGAVRLFNRRPVVKTAHVSVKTAHALLKAAHALLKTAHVLVKTAHVFPCKSLIINMNSALEIRKC
jgi:hypothetical protein